MGLNSEDEEQTHARLESELNDSSIARLVAYDERVRKGEPNDEADQALELDNPEWAKAIRALRDVLGNPVAGCCPALL